MYKVLFTVGVAMLIFIAPLSNAYELIPELGIRVELHDNARQASSGAEDDISYQPYVGFQFTNEGERLFTSINFRAEYERYQDTFDDDTRLYADAYLGFGIIPGRLIWNLQDSATVQRINALGFNLPDNTQRVNVLATGPEIYLERNVWRTIAKAQVSQVTYEESDEYDASGLSASISLYRDLNEYSSLGLSISYNENEYDELSTFLIPILAGSTATTTFTQSDYDVSKYAVVYQRELPYGQLTAKAGHNSLDNGKETLDEPYYDLRLVYDAGANLVAGLTLRSQLTDPIVNSFNPDDTRIRKEGIAAPTRLGTNDNQSYHLMDELALDLRYEAGRYHPQVQLFSTTRDYYGVEPEEEEFGVRGSLLIDLTERSGVTLSASRTKLDYVNLATEDTNTGFEFAYNYQILDGINLQAGYGLSRRTSNLGNRDGDDNIFFLELNYTGEAR